MNNLKQTRDVIIMNKVAVILTALTMSVQGKLPELNGYLS